MEVGMRWIERVVILSVLFVAAPAAQAAVWAVNAAGCTPASDIRYTAGAGTVSYRSTSTTGPITLFCPIATVPVCPAAYRVRLTYQDTDGTGSGVSVTAQLMRQSQKDGAFVGPVPGASVTSNGSGQTSPTNRTSIEFDHDFAALTDDYSFRIDLNRFFGSSQVAVFYGVALECAE
jgi:hypothetical protein